MTEFINASCHLILSTGICDFIEPRPYLWWVPLLIIGLSTLIWLAEKIPALQLVKARLLLPLAEWVKFKFLQRAAIAANIAADVNVFVSQIKGEIPSRWLPNIKIEWVKNETKQEILRDGIPVLRMRPLANQGGNFVRAVHAFFDRNMFPRTADLVPATLREAAVLEITRKLIHRRRPSLREILDDEVLEPAVKARHEVLEYLDRFDHLDKRGYFTGSFLREVHAIVTEARYLPVRNSLPKEIKGILSHNETFMDTFAKSQQENPPPAGKRDSIPPEMWSKKGAVTNYAFLLVAAPRNAESNAVRIFVNKARERIDAGVDRLYIFGAQPEKWFARSVIKAISKNVPEYKLLETFKSEYDYRGKPGGVGAIFVRR